MGSYSQDVEGGEARHFSQNPAWMISSNPQFSINGPSLGPNAFQEEGKFGIFPNRLMYTNKNLQEIGY